jgi:hypothetical protein
MIISATTWRCAGTTLPQPPARQGLLSDRSLEDGAADA